jgi:hypothetical protein
MRHCHWLAVDLATQVDSQLLARVVEGYHRTQLSLLSLLWAPWQLAGQNNAMDSTHGHHHDQHCDFE